MIIHVLGRVDFPGVSRQIQNELAIKFCCRQDTEDSQVESCTSVYKPCFQHFYCSICIHKNTWKQKGSEKWVGLRSMNGRQVNARWM